MLIILVPSVCIAGSHLGIGAALDGFFPLDPELYGERMVGNSWGKDIYDKGWSTGSDRVHFTTPNRYNFILSPVLTQSLFWDYGLGIELTEQIQYLHFSPNQDVDVTFDRFMLPLRLTLKWNFLPKAKVQPFVGAGGGYTYVITRVAGKDLYNQRTNPDYALNDADDADASLDADSAPDSSADRYLQEQLEFGMSGWYPSAHALAGFNVPIKDGLALIFTVRYEYMNIESLDVELVLEGDDQWQWNDRRLEGDAGGVGTSFGVFYYF